MEKIFGKPLITQEEILHRVRELGLQITEDYAGKNLILIGILKGAFAFTADLSRCIGIPARIDFLMTSTQESSGQNPVKTISEPTLPLSGADILLVEDIVDSGVTARMLLDKLSAHKPKSVRICALLDKTGGRTLDVRPDYVGFSIPNKFVIGYGLDYKNKYRTLPFIAVLDDRTQS
ncbi:hypoxanthine phosphoribosyltransferase [Leptospirillum ferriphilum]|jgi:hypoxanthine phosphoribosyltransferase|uniref:Hypoxanthine phosphoribosyltransferase n=3 Tax=Leptospirillum TaxID=179 RepID=A0A094YL28_9BACT|nr:hypoxanthine phosphoribosyltransferase [Leptospirillum ferriphilum]AFS54189.1 hypoxanthine-guanine phosphoribosyltransferase [Leptospirillum ferriphilum ML-04]EDZ40463.1 MAG: Hypoxanthine phosphoribosyl transferase [Leptospirillum sp. Group II '5-way CG']KGA93931.1 Hypoxanthine-guanine phosphoribosyltransferase [Leptospirillum ferriphilum]